MILLGPGLHLKDPYDCPNVPTYYKGRVAPCKVRSNIDPDGHRFDPGKMAPHYPTSFRQRPYSASKWWAEP